MDQISGVKPVTTSIGELFRQNESGDDPHWLKDLRSRALERFLDTGFPSKRNEEYKYTDLLALNEQKFKAPDKIANVRQFLSSIGAGEREHPTVFLINGYPELSLSNFSGNEGVHIRSLSETLWDGSSTLKQTLLSTKLDRINPLALLNTAFLRQGLVIRIDPGTRLSKPLVLEHITLSDGEALGLVQPSCVVFAGADSRVQVLERWTGSGDAKYFSNSMCRLILDKNAKLTHLCLQQETDKAYSFSSVHAEVGEGAHFNSFSLSAGATLARNDIVATLKEQEARASLFGLYLTHDGQHVDHHTLVDHAVAKTHSEELYKGVLDGKSTGVFNGKIIVRPDAQEVDARQNNANLLLSESAKVNTKPQLEIFADNVRCGHGATIGSLDEEALFYLRSRGIEEQEANRMLIGAFASEILDRLPQNGGERLGLDQLWRNQYQELSGGSHA